MAEAFLWVDLVADQLLELFDLGKTAFATAVENQFTVYGNDIGAGQRRGLEAYGMDVTGEGGKQLLRHIGGPEHPAALRTVFYCDGRLH